MLVMVVVVEYRIYIHKTVRLLPGNSSTNCDNVRNFMFCLLKISDRDRGLVDLFKIFTTRAPCPKDTGAISVTN